MKRPTINQKRPHLRPSRVRRPPDRYGLWATDGEIENLRLDAALTGSNEQEKDILEPKSFNEAMQTQHAVSGNRQQMMRCIL